MSTSQTARPKPDTSRIGRARDHVAYLIATFAFNFIATEWYARMIEGAIRLGLEAARQEDYNSNTVHIDLDNK